MSVTLDRTNALLVRCGEKLKKKSDGADCGCKNLKRGLVGSGALCAWRVWSQAVGFVFLAGVWLQWP
jgi:hypothetical protein